MKHFDAIVLGLGAMGSSAVYQLAKRGSRVLGLDQYSPPHDRGSSHGETRITRLAIGEGAHYSPLALRSNRLPCHFKPRQNILYPCRRVFPEHRCRRA